MNRSQTDESLTGVVERITFHTEESGYTIARFKLPKMREQITVVGNFANIQAGQTLQLQGFWKTHPQYGQQFQVKQYSVSKPATLNGIEKYLGSGLIKGVGPVTAKKIVAHFGLDTLEIIEQTPERLIETPGIGDKRVRLIQSAWIAQKAIKEVMMFLQGQGVSTLYAVKIYKQYGSKAISTVQDNPYQLADDIYGIGFLTADKIAQQVGVSPWSKFRYQSALLHCLREASEDGHCFLPRSDLVEQTVSLLSSDEHTADVDSVDSVVEEMGAQKTLEIEGGTEEESAVCYHPVFFNTEKHLAQLLHHRLSSTATIDIERVRNWIARYTQSRKLLSV